MLIYPVNTEEKFIESIFRVLARALFYFDEFRGDVVEYQIASEIATSQAVWAILCIVLAAYFIRETRKEKAESETRLLMMHEEQRKESAQREKNLMEHLKRSNASQEKTSETLEQIQFSLTSLENRMDRVEKHYTERS
ncbi:hypothetical protein BkAM31D_02515 [Halalkalibacter krulwichiae]|uniref:Uncharacterized protein n=1 Tax=Halalkalibacter krulwichiae TaxID=199441 RepID=A0A1X9M9G3_9BACI|nr:hypothetical protein BkAM31D_02515 [Halalkalibacter krulwichiae]